MGDRRSLPMDPASMGHQVCEETQRISESDHF